MLPTPFPALWLSMRIAMSIHQLFIVAIAAQSRTHGKLKALGEFSRLLVFPVSNRTSRLNPYKFWGVLLYMILSVELCYELVPSEQSP